MLVDSSFTFARKLRNSPSDCVKLTQLPFEWRLIAETSTVRLMEDAEATRFQVESLICLPVGMATHNSRLAHSNHAKTRVHEKNRRSGLRDPGGGRVCGAY